MEDDIIWVKNKGLLDEFEIDLLHIWATLAETMFVQKWDQISNSMILANVL